MIHGLFPQAERAVVVGVLESSVVFLTPENIAKELEKISSQGEQQLRRQAPQEAV